MPFRLRRKLSMNTEKLTISVLPRDGQDLLAYPISVRQPQRPSQEPLSLLTVDHTAGAPVAATKITLCVAYFTAALTLP